MIGVYDIADVVLRCDIKGIPLTEEIESIIRPLTNEDVAAYRRLKVRSSDDKLYAIFQHGMDTGIRFYWSSTHKNTTNSAFPYAVKKGTPYKYEARFFTGNLISANEAAVNILGRPENWSV